MRVIDLFSGAGGFTAGAEAAGATVIWAGNHWRLAVDVHELNHPNTDHVRQDLHQADWSQVPEMDLVVASPACQAHSTAATRGGVSGRRGTAPRHDALRSTAWAVVSCVEVHRPPFVVVENVLDFRNWELYDVWRAALAKLGYALQEHVVNAADLGVPQERVRLFIVAARGDSPFVLGLKKRPHVGFETCIDMDATSWEPVSRKPAPVKERVAKGRSNFPEGMFVTQHVTGHPGRSIGRPIATITTKHQLGLVRPGRRGDEMRMLNVNEYRRAMGFPEGYWLPPTTCDSVKLLGNAVCPPVAKAIVSEIMRRA